MVWDRARVFFIGSRFRVRLGVRIAFWLESRAFRLRVSVEMDELVLGLETITFRVIVIMRIRYS